MNLLHRTPRGKSPGPSPARRPGNRTGRSAARLLALIGLLAASLAGPATAAHASDYTASNLPDWAIGPFRRQAQPNPAPVLSPAGTGWESQHVLNPGVVYRTRLADALPAPTAAGRTRSATPPAPTACTSPGTRPTP